MKVEHDSEKHKFFVTVGDYEAVLMYAEKERVLDFYHIYVPDPFRNRGIAAKILIRPPQRGHSIYRGPPPAPHFSCLTNVTMGVTM